MEAVDPGAARRGKDEDGGGVSPLFRSIYLIHSPLKTYASAFAFSFSLSGRIVAFLVTRLLERSLGILRASSFDEMRTYSNTSVENFGFVVSLQF